MDSQTSTSIPRMKDDSVSQHLLLSATRFTSTRKLLIPVGGRGRDNYSTNKSGGVRSRVLFNGKDREVKENPMGRWLYARQIHQFLSIYNYCILLVYKLRN